MQDPFDTLGIEPRFALDLAQAEERHRTLARMLHPDRNAGRPPAERRLALGRAIEVNSAWRALRDPISRAECLLVRAGVAVGEGNEPRPSAELLMEMMEEREALSVARSERNAVAVEKLANAMRAKERALLEALARAFDEAGGDRDVLAQRALADLGALRYVRRFFAEVEAIEEELAS